MKISCFGTIYRGLALVSLFLSFFTPSLLVFYVVVVFYLLYHYRNSLLNLSTLVRLPIRYLDFLLLPFIYWIIKNNLIKTGGLYSEYNKINEFSLGAINNLIKESFIHSYIDVIGISIPSSVIGILFVLLIFWFLGYLIYVRMENKSKKGFNARINNVFFICLGISIFIAGIYAYISVGKVPMLSN